jgi:O-acetylserine/cysteine efflux transporter
VTLRDFLLAILVIAIWGFHTVIIKLGVLEVPPFALLSLRLFFTGLLFFPFIRTKEIRASFLQLVKVSLLLSLLTFGLTFSALQRLEAGTFSVLMELQALFSVMLAIFVFKEKVPAKVIWGVIIGLCGLLIILGTPQVMENQAGALLALAAAVSWVLATLAMKTLPAISFPSYIVATALPALPFCVMASALLERGQMAALAGADYKILTMVLAYQAVLISSALALWQRLLTRNSFSRLNPLRVLTPVFGILGGVLFLGEEITIQFGLGTLCVLTGIYFIASKKGRALKP